jgi:hypothetical protein
MEAMQFDAMQFIDQSIEIEQKDIRYRFVLSGVLVVAGIVVYAVVFATLHHLGFNASDKSASGMSSWVISEVLPLGTGLFTAAWGFAPIKPDQIKDRWKNIMRLKAAKALPPDQLNAIVIDGVRAALKA